MAMAGQMLPTFLPLHYKKNLSTASGISFAGTALGAFLYSSFYEHVLEAYGISGSFLILSAISLNTLPAVMFLAYSKRRWKLSERIKYVDNEEKNERLLNYTKLDTSSALSTFKLGNKILSNDCNKNCVLDTSVAVIDHQLDDIKNDYSEDIECGNTPEEINSPTPCNVCISNSEDYQDTLNEEDTSLNKTTDSCRSQSHSHIKKDGKDSCRCDNQANSPDETSIKLLADSHQVTPILDPKEKTNWKIFTLFYDPLFLVLAFTHSSSHVVNQLFLIAIVDHALDKGVSMNLSSYFLMLSSVFDLCGRLFLGPVTDGGCMTVTNFSALCYFCMGAMFTGIALSTEFYGMLISICFGAVLTGGHVLISPVLIAEYFGGDRRTLAMTSQTFLGVPLTFAISPLIGYFREGLGSYVWLFYSLAIFQVFECILHLFLPCIAKLGRYQRDDKIVV